MKFCSLEHIYSLNLLAMLNLLKIQVLLDKFKLLKYFLSFTRNNKLIKDKTNTNLSKPGLTCVNDFFISFYRIICSTRYGVQGKHGIAC